jgi:FMN-dependent NADH-azoreductase
MIRIACTALAKRIMAGRISKNGIEFIGKPQDVTSDALKAVIEFIGINETHVVTVDGKPMFEISVHQVEEVQS